MILIGLEGIFSVWYNPATHGYRFTGGQYGKHEITCNRVMHNHKGLYGRAAAHWAGYKGATA